MRCHNIENYADLKLSLNEMMNKNNSKKKSFVTQVLLF